MIAKTITVNQQTRNQETTTPKGRTRRTIPMTGALHAALKRVETIREGFVVRKTWTVRRRRLARRTPRFCASAGAILRICRRAGLPVHGFHRLRHSFGTHAALFGVNPWRLQAWMGHKRIDETMLYVHVAEAHHCELPKPCHGDPIGNFLARFLEPTQIAGRSRSRPKIRSIWSEREP